MNKLLLKFHKCKIFNIKKISNFVFLLIITFILSRFLYYVAGIRFEVMMSAWQFFPIQFYESDLLSSIYYSIYQPPLLNLLIGIGIKLGQLSIFLHMIYLFLGLIAFINFYKILNCFLSQKNSFLISAILMVMPLTILWENHGYKDYLTMCLFINIFYYSLLVINKDSYKNYFFLGINLILIGLLRETFHYFWLLFLLIFIFYCNKNLKKTFFLFLITSFFVLPFYLKNYLVFGKFQIAGLMYENLTQKTLYTQQMKNGEHRLLKKIIFKNEENFIKFFANLSDINETLFESPAKYKEVLNYKNKHTHPLLHSQTFHHEIFLEVDEIRKRDLFLYAKEYPSVFVFSFLNAFSRHFFNSSENFLFLENNAKKIPTLIRFSHCIKLTLLCFSEDNNYSRKNYSQFSYKEKIYFSLQQINFLVLIIYSFMFYHFVKFILIKKEKNRHEKTFIFFSLNVLFMLFILLVFEETELPRHRFPFEYLIFLFSLYYYKKNKKKIFK